MTITDIVIIGMLCFEASINLVFLHNMLEPKYSLKKCLSIGWPVIWVCTIVGYLKLQTNVLERQILYNIVYFSFGKILYRDSKKKILFSMLILYVILFILDLLVAVIVYKVFPMDGYPQDTIRLTGNLLFDLMYPVAVGFFLKIWKQRKEEIQGNGILFTLFFPFSQYLLLDMCVYCEIQMLIAEKAQYATVILIIIGWVLSIGGDIMMFRALMENSRKERVRIQLEMMEEQAYRDLEHYRAVNEKILTIRKIRHDFNNQLQTAYGVFLSETPDKKEQAVQILNQMQGRVRNNRISPESHEEVLISRETQFSEPQKSQ